MDRNVFFKEMKNINGFSFNNPKDWYADSIMLMNDKNGTFSLIGAGNDADCITREQVENYKTTFGKTIGELIDNLKNMNIEFGPNGNGEEFKIIE